MSVVEKQRANSYTLEEQKSKYKKIVNSFEKVKLV
jgi:hypothetical protein